MKLKGIFINKSVLELAIQDHIRELDLLYSEHKISKNSDKPINTKIIEDHIENELADLYILLHNFLDEETIQKRLNKFHEKEQNDFN